MNGYEVLFLLLFLWSSIFTVSFAFHGFKRKKVFPAVNAVILEIAASILCVIYLFY